LTLGLLQPDAAKKAQGTAFSPDEFPAAFTDAFELGAALGSGTVAVVRLAKRRSDGRHIAVKCVSSSDDEVRQFTRDEYDLVRSLNHPAIIRFSAMYETSAKMLICMEYCGDGCVQSYVEKQGVFDEGIVRSLGYQLLRGANYLHEKRVVHRDLKPENLLLQGQATILKIVDFNSAKRIGSAAGSSLMLTDRGTPEYRAPELRFGLLWNERVDVWSSGLCLYFMLWGKLPFDSQGKKVKEALSKGCLPTVDLDGLTSPMKTLITECLTVKMQDRPLALMLLLHPAFRTWYRRPEPISGCSANAERCGLGRVATYAGKECPAEPFALHRRCGLVAILTGAKKPCLGSPESRSPDVGGVEEAGSTSCFLLGPTVEKADNEDASPSPRQMLRFREAQKHSSYASFREPRRFDALLLLADKSFQ
jgi:serine/threonine protein kinase